MPHASVSNSKALFCLIMCLLNS